MVEIWQRVVGEFTETWGELAEKYFLLSLMVRWRKACRELAERFRELAESGGELAEKSLRNHRK